MCVTFSIHMCIYACLHTSRLIHKLSSTTAQHNPVLAAMGPWGGLHPHCYLGIVVLQVVIPPFYLSALLLSPYFWFCLLSNLSAHWNYLTTRSRAIICVHPQLSENVSLSLLITSTQSNSTNFSTLLPRLMRACSVPNAGANRFLLSPPMDNGRPHLVVQVANESYEPHSVKLCADYVC